MNADVLCAEVLREMGGQVDEHRHKAFLAFCRALIRHIQVHGVVQVVGVQSGSGTASGKVL